jgi:hypothetical protein
MKTDKKRSLLEDGLLTACRAIENQVAREMQRNPAQLEQHGVQKWEPYSKRVESICTFLLEETATNEGHGISLDALLVLSQSVTKALSILTEELGEKGLGKVRSSYVREAAKNLKRDIMRIEGETSASPEIC